MLRLIAATLVCLLVVSAKRVFNGTRCSKNQVISRLTVFEDGTLEAECGPVPCGEVGRRCIEDQTSCRADTDIFSGMRWAPNGQRLSRLWHTENPNLDKHEASSSLHIDSLPVIAAAMRVFYATCIVILLQTKECTTFDLLGWFSDAVDSVKKSDPVTKDWAQGLQQWSSTDWDCGADRIWMTKLITKSIAEKKCPTVLEQINSACRWHDFCYAQGLEGQIACDTKFCDALQAIKFTTIEEQKACDLTRTMCDAVKFGGSLIYRDKTNQ